MLPSGLVLQGVAALRPKASARKREAGPTPHQLHMDRRSAANVERCTTHGHADRATGPSPTYWSWRAAKMRCFRKTSPTYARYGAQGITMCDEWRESFSAFLRDMGERPSGTTLDRFPNRRGNYEPGNCRWATPEQQAWNRDPYVTNNQWGGPRQLEHAGESLSIPEWSKRTGISVHTLHARLRTGWPVAAALTVPVSRSNTHSRWSSRT
jgi:hypothetical protein